jgi:hypothetical protein
MTTLGKYELSKKIATGGMAEVWLARQTGPEGFKRSLVVKRILPHLADDPQFVQMLLNEAKIAARLTHPNIAQIYDLGLANGEPFIAMELVRGRNLGRLIRKSWSRGYWIAQAISLRIVADCCEALSYAHAMTDDDDRPLRIVHRDISPQNILISFDGSVKLVDFGIAKAADVACPTLSGQLKGKFAYMSPEQTTGKGLDYRSDIFALGLVLYELLTGVRPLQREGELATLAAAKLCQIAPPSSISEDVTPELDAMVMRALAPRPEDRYQDARELQMDLEEYLIARRWVATSLQISELMDILFSDKPRQAAPKEIPEITAPVEAYQAPPGLATPGAAPMDPNATYIFQPAELEALAAAERHAAAYDDPSGPGLFPDVGLQVHVPLKRRPHRIEVRRATGPRRWARRRNLATELQTTALERRVETLDPDGRVAGARALEICKGVGTRALVFARAGLLALWKWSEARLSAFRARGGTVEQAPRPSRA